MKIYLLISASIFLNIITVFFVIATMCIFKDWRRKDD